MDWDNCNNRTLLESAAQLAKGAGQLGGTVSQGCLYNTQQCQAGLCELVQALEANCQLRICMGLAWQWDVLSQVESSINKIFSVTKLMELPPHSTDVDLSCTQKGKVLHSYQRDSVYNFSRVGVSSLDEGRGGVGASLDCRWNVLGDHTTANSCTGVSYQRMIQSKLKCSTQENGMKAPKSSQKICDSVALPEVDRKMH